MRLQVDKAVAVVEADILHVHKGAGDARLLGAVLQVLHGAAVLHRILAAGQVQAVSGHRLAQLREALDQALLQGVELVGAVIDQAAVDLLLQPEPLPETGFVKAGGGVGVVLVQLGRVPAIVGQVDAAV